MRCRHICLLAVLNGLLVGVSACASSPKLSVALHQSERGKVSLEPIPDGSFQAAHPIKLPADTIARVFRGMLVRDDQNSRERKPDALRAFPEEDVVFLAPLIADGLTHADTDQQIGFIIKQTDTLADSQRIGAPDPSSKPPPPEWTTGFIYAYGQSLYVTLTQYRYRTERLDTINMANRHLPEETGLVNHTVLFTPESAKRPDSYRDSQSTDNSIVINYELLARLPPDLGPAPPSPPIPTAESSSAVQPTATQGKPARKDPEVEALRKELEEIKRQLAEQEAQRNSAQPKKSVTPKVP